MNHDDISGLTPIIHALKYRSRRWAKRLIREAGGHGSADELNQLLEAVRHHPRRDEIEAEAEAMEAARMEAERRSHQQPEEFPQWLIGETPGEASTWIMHLCPGGAQSFIGRVFDRPGDPRGEHAPTGWQSWPLAEGQILSLITWLDGDPPPIHEQEKIMAEAARQLRVYDAAEAVGICAAAAKVQTEAAQVAGIVGGLV